LITKVSAEGSEKSVLNLDLQKVSEIGTTVSLIKMEGRGALTADEAFVKLQLYFNQHGKDISINQLFAQDPERFEKFQ